MLLANKRLPDGNQIFAQIMSLLKSGNHLGLTNGWRHFGQLEQHKSSVLFPIQSEKSPDSGFFACDPTKKCIMPSSHERLKGIIGRGHDLRLTQLLQVTFEGTTVMSFVFLQNEEYLSDFTLQVIAVK